MNLTVRTLAKGNFTLEVDPSDTILRVKEKIDERHKVGEPSLQKLVHSGKVLADSQVAITPTV